MFLDCPRCESNRLDALGTCSRCGYSLRVTCESCGFMNIPQAKYCGSCGAALTLKVKAQTFINRHLSFYSQLRVRKFAAGLAFGTVLGIFAFGSMGMYSKSGQSQNDMVMAVNPQIANLHETRIFAELNEFRNSRNVDGYAGFNDLRKFIDILANFRSDEKTTLETDSSTADDYLTKARVQANRKQISRANLTMSLFYLACDRLHANYKDFPETLKYNDIPRFHYLSVPVAALDSLGVNLSRNKDEFGMRDGIKIETLFQVGLAMAEAIDIRFKQKFFYSLHPR